MGCRQATKRRIEMIEQTFKMAKTTSNQTVNEIEFIRKPTKERTMNLSSKKMYAANGSDMIKMGDN